MNKQNEDIEKLNVEMKDDKIIVTKESFKPDIKPKKKLRKQTETVENLDNIMNQIYHTLLDPASSLNLCNYAKDIVAWNRHAYRWQLWEHVKT